MLCVRDQKAGIGRILLQYLPIRQIISVFKKRQDNPLSGKSAKCLQDQAVMLLVCCNDNRLPIRMTHQKRLQLLTDHFLRKRIKLSLKISPRILRNLNAARCAVQRES